jgi:hypothetical protein
MDPLSWQATEGIADTGHSAATFDDHRAGIAHCPSGRHGNAKALPGRTVAPAWPWRFGCAGQASKIKVMPLDRMAERYARGELNQIVK